LEEEHMGRRLKLAVAAAAVTFVYGAGQVSAASPVLTTLATFSTSTGTKPVDGVILDSLGNLYGTTYTGGTYNVGTVFSVPAGGGAVNTLVNFNTTNGASPVVTVTADSSGNLYGVTTLGGSSNYGTVFKVPEAGGPLTTIVSFTKTNGAEPEGALLADAAGNFYGTTAYGGQGNDGTLFKIAAGGGALTTLGYFTGGSNGSTPEGKLAFTKGGQLAGTTINGGDSLDGALYFTKTTPAPIYSSSSMTNAIGTGLNGGVVVDSSLDVFGTAYLGGSDGYGSVYKWTPSGGFALLASFNSTNGSHPFGGSLIVDAAGNLFGTTESGGMYNLGTVFEIPEAGGPITTVFSFNGTDGSDPVGGLTVDASGNIYGTTALGGANNLGTVYEITNSGFVTSVPEPAGVVFGASAGLLAVNRPPKRLIR
jgi:uncharacterized repeat protein (TIGR03803 family)